MANITWTERQKLEGLLKMGEGYVLDFSDRTFSEFFDQYRIKIDDECYRVHGTSKANRMRTFWKLDADREVGRVINGLIECAEQRFEDNNTPLIDDCRKIAQRLLDQPISELDALTATSDEYDFELVAKHVREAIEKGQPEGGLDRLHTFVIKFMRNACEPHGIEISRGKPLHSIFGKYVHALRAGGHFESTMTERILKSSISVLDAFNEVRNNKSLAHDNPILNYEESLLIFNHVAASIRFIKKALEAKAKAKDATTRVTPLWMSDDVPF